MSRTYKWMVPYMKCLHLTIDGWREGRDHEGWKVKLPKGMFTIWEWEDEKWIDVSETELKALSSPQSSIPDMVVPVPRF